MDCSGKIEIHLSQTFLNLWGLVHSVRCDLPSARFCSVTACAGPSVCRFCGRLGMMDALSMSRVLRHFFHLPLVLSAAGWLFWGAGLATAQKVQGRSEEHTSELQS